MLNKMDYTTWFVVLEVLISILAGLFFYIKRKYSYWSNQGLNGPRPSLLNFGNVIQLEGAQPDVVELEMLRKYGKVYGTYTGLQPTLVVLDEHFIKTVLVKDFYAFTDRRSLNTFHELVNVAQFFTEGKHWAKTRAITRMAFTSGRLKAMTPLFDRCVGQLLDHLDTIVVKGSSFEPMPVLMNFSIDAIAATAFASEINSNSGERTKGPLLTHALDFFTISPLKALSYFALPKFVNDLLGVKHIFNAGSFDYATSLIKEILKQRKIIDKKGGNSQKHKDLIQLLMDAYVEEEELVEQVERRNFDNLEMSLEKDIDENISTTSTKIKTNKLTLTENEIIAQSILFFVAAFETVTSALTSVFYELTVNESIQARLYAELAEAFDNTNLNVHSDDHSNTLYERLMNGLPYLDAVCKEALRKYPPGKKLERRVTVDHFRLGNVLLKRGQLVEIPLMGVMRNEEYFPEPEVFKPERFLKSHSLCENLGPFLSFGLGPRNCIGTRFAYLEMKMLLSKMLLRFKFTPTAATPTKLTFETFKPSLMPMPFSVEIEKRV